MMRVLLCLILVVGINAEAQQLNKATFEEQVVKSGKNAFVKFFAPWCGHCKAMKPAWDQLAEVGWSNVVIADVDCTVEEGLCGEFGVQGYPTIKYFEGTKEAKDYSGGRDLDSLKSFVEDTLEVKCDVKAQEGCTQKEKDYITKMQAKDAGDVKKQLDRLQGMLGGKMTPEAKQWLVQRLNILKQL